jgi:uncharacterized lipoprotein YddW (UPF0748 family)
MKKTLLLLWFTMTLSLASAFAQMTETRGVWVDKRQLLQGEEFLDGLFSRLARANFTTVNLCVLFQGYVIYPDSEHLAQHPQYREKDYLQIAIDLAHKHGLKAYAWMEFGFYGFYSPDVTASPSLGPIFDAHPSWLSFDRDGNYFIRNQQWGDFLPISPVNPDAQNFLIDVHVETIQRYPFDGIDLDRIRYGNADFCFSDTTRVLFLRETGIDLRRMEKGSPEEGVFTEWKKAQLNLFVQRFSKRLREARPEILITSAVASPETNNSFGQDWPTWAHYGWLDGLSPMLYTRNIAPVATRSKELVPEGYPLFYGVDSGINTPEQVVEQIRYLRSIGAKGFVFWFAGTLEDDLDLLRETVFAEPAEEYRSQRPVTAIYSPPDLREMTRAASSSQTPAPPSPGKEPGQH